MIIQHLPSFLQRCFSSFRPHVSRPQFAHLWSLVLGMIINLNAAKLVHLAAVAPKNGHRTRAGAFLAHSDWDAPALVHQAAMDLLMTMKPRAGEVAYLILDDTRLPKCGRQMDYVSKIWDHKQQRFVYGHMVLTAAILFRGVVLPWRIELWKPRGHSGPRYRKITAMAAGMIQDFVPPAGLKVRVLFDAFYLCPTVTQACESRGFCFFSVAQRNRNFTTLNHKTRRIARLMPGLIRHRGRTVRMARSRGKTATLRIASADGHLSRIGRVRMVISKRPRGPWKKCIAIVTNETTLRPRQIVAIYEKRWAIEVLFKELVQDLGLGDYQMLHKDGIVHHLHICCLAHLLLTRQSIDRLGAQATQPTKQVELPTMSLRLQTLRADIAREEIGRVLKGDAHARVRKKILNQLLPRAA